jgi:hypothetical protein
VTGIVAGAASLVTATMWWGYPILVPCIISSVFCNYIWRQRIGYDRPLFGEAIPTDKVSLIEELRLVTSARQIFEEAPSEWLSKLVSNPESFASVIEFIIKNDFFEDFCIRLLQDTSLSTSLFGPSNEEMTIDPQDLITADKQFLPGLFEIAQTSVSEMGPTRFKYRERYLLETLGCYLCTAEVSGEIQITEKGTTEEIHKRRDESVRTTDQLAQV